VTFKKVPRGTKKDIMAPRTKERVVQPTRIEDHLLPDNKIIRLYTLERKDTYLWNVLEVTVSHNRVVTVSRDVPSLKEIKMEKLLDLIESGDPLSETDR
jgi:hypothetical protein